MITKTIGIGTVARIIISSEKKKFTTVVTIDGLADKEENCISVSSPVGKALLGKKVGDKTRYQVGGRQFNIQVLSIEN